MFELDNVNTGMHLVDNNIIDAVKLWFVFGISPGSCTTLLLRGDYEEANTHAHVSIKEDNIWESHIFLMEHYIPPSCRGDNVDSWTGLLPYTDEDMTFYTLGGGVRHSSYLDVWLAYAVTWTDHHA